MFGIFKDKKIKHLEAKVESYAAQATHIYSKKNEIEDDASRELYWLSVRNGVTAAESSRTPEGMMILSEVVLNKQYASYLNEQAIQAYAELCRAREDGTATSTKSQWLKNIVMKSGGDIVSKEIDALMLTLVKEVDDKIDRER